MKPKFHQVPKPLDNTFSIRHDILPHFGTIWHYHPEIELHYLMKGDGIRFIGENISNFEKDELILLGSNIPHTWKCNVKEEDNDYVEALVMHFHPECLGRDFLSLPETKSIQRLVTLANQGLLIKGETKKKARKLMMKMKDEQGVNKIVFLLRIFDILAHSDEYEIISSNYSNTKFNKIDENRMNKIFTYTFSNFKSKILIEELAELSNLSITSFCRYFKMTTSKSYFDFLTELRLNYACRLLINSDLTVKAIAEESGFENTSNFYRHFKNFKNCTPKDFKESYMP
ncbi:AraC family transcriptional regulator [Sphingobacterium sp. SGG-5]|uniref:AraC family transcriptional regulator n=1 Tax=Sphingobacterium sp. SGG-5 TaxID=2710881 RepID=UPI0013EA0E94|nr:AraC family transcriptional regulator [Sphingobacterium sp. SGG-5]NGM61325.1 AraC family transcriptional regulator [Sphingobacterium sp. SGG-5]